MYKSHVQINTDPTELGEYLKVTDYFYPAKRIRSKGLRGFDKDLWVLFRQAQEKGLVKVEFSLAKTFDSMKN